MAKPIALTTNFDGAKYTSCTCPQFIKTGRRTKVEYPCPHKANRKERQSNG